VPLQISAKVVIRAPQAERQVWAECAGLVDTFATGGRRTFAAFCLNVCMRQCHHNVSVQSRKPAPIEVISLQRYSQDIIKTLK
jgi:hypothetical protein